MKITATQYAQSLCEATEGKSHSEIDSVVENFVKILAKNNQIKNIGNIIEKFKKIWNRKNEIVEMRVTSKEKLSGPLAEKLNNFIKKKYQVKGISMENIVDEKIKGGIVVQVGDEVMDGSLARQLKELKSFLQK
jgi:F-type H+-transporting ATPase subunit delta